MSIPHEVDFTPLATWQPTLNSCWNRWESLLASGAGCAASHSYQHVPVLQYVSPSNRGKHTKFKKKLAKFFAHNKLKTSLYFVTKLKCWQRQTRYDQMHSNWTMKWFYFTKFRTLTSSGVSTPVSLNFDSYTMITHKMHPLQFSATPYSCNSF